ncbi:hypothetical protein V5O48_006565 [Marasmius crinis-equi]|uniref:Uncharacterized protein n=1 Tax=Marasmius crinis-equi TaxID=585013 RepID=A0ABR3FJ50_9AGAR
MPRAAIENFARDDLERDVSRVGALDVSAANRLRDILKTKRWLLRGCLDAQAYFWKQLDGDDMDFGSATYRRSLKRRCNEVETLLSATEEHLQELYLSHLGALWVLDGRPPSGTVSQFLEACCEYPEVMVDEAQIPPPPDKTLSSNRVTDPVEEAQKRKKYATMIGIWDYIATMCTPPESQFFQERLAVIHAHIARCIVSDATLFLAARKYHSVEEFLQDLDHDIIVYERLKAVLSQNNVHSVRAAIDDVLRPSDDSEYITFLGGRLYRDLSTAPLPFRAWGHWAAFFPSSCSCAVQKGFSTGADISLSSKFMQLHGILPPSHHSGRIRSSLETLQLCGIHLGPLDPVELRHCIQKRNTTDGQPLWVETHNTIPFSGWMPTDEPISSLFISACMRHPDLMIKLRRGNETTAADFPDDLWSSRSRQAPSCESLEATPWELFPPSDKNLHNIQRHNLSTELPLKDCLDFAVFDASDCDFEHAVEKLAEICLVIHGVRDLRGLYDRYIQSYVKEGELQVDANGELLFINCVPEDRWLMRMHLLGVVLPTRAQDQRTFERRFRLHNRNIY